MEPWHLWLILTILLMVLEIFFPSFFAASLAIGCAFAGLAAFLELDLIWQLLFLSAGILLSFFFVRPLMLRYAYRSAGQIRMNTDALIGRTAVVSQEIDNDTNQGRVAVDGDDWRAVSETGEVIGKGTKVSVIRRESLILYVKPL